jgi:hypothetical protein
MLRETEPKEEVVGVSDILEASVVRIKWVGRPKGSEFFEKRLENCFGSPFFLEFPDPFTQPVVFRSLSSSLSSS